MLRNRSRAVTGKQASMADHTSSSSSQNHAKTIPSFFGSPRFRAFSVLGISETDVSLISPTSVLDSKPFSLPFYKGKPEKIIFSETKHYWDNSQDQAIGLALIEERNDSKPSKSVLFSAKLRVQIPSLSPKSAVSSTDSPRSPADFGTKTQLSNSNSAETKSAQIVSGFISVSETEMKLSEEYTCVRIHGPNPKTTHIFDNCVVKSFHSQSGKSMAAAAKNFLSFCHTCKKNLEQTNDIYIYRGEKAFCSHDCRYQEMLLDELI